MVSEGSTEKAREWALKTSGERASRWREGQVQRPWGVRRSGVSRGWQSGLEESRGGRTVALTKEVVTEVVSTAGPGSSIKVSQ